MTNSAISYLKFYRIKAVMLCVIALGMSVTGNAKTDLHQQLAPLLGIVNIIPEKSALSNVQLPETIGQKYFDEVRKGALELLDSTMLERDRITLNQCRAVVASSYLTTVASMAHWNGVSGDAADKFFDRLNSGFANVLNANPQIRVRAKSKYVSMPEMVAGPVPLQDHSNEMILYPWFDPIVTYLMISVGSALARRDASSLHHPNMDIMIDKESSSESFPDWSSRVCRRFMYIDSEYVEYIHVSMNVDDNDNGLKKNANVNFTISNTANRRLKGSLIMAALGIEPAGENRFFNLQFARIIVFDLKPTQEMHMSEKFSYEVPFGHGIQLMLGTEIGEGPIEVTALDREEPIGTCAERLLQRSSHDVFGTSLAAYAMDSEKGYTNSALIEKSNNGLQIYDGKYPVPGTLKTTVYMGGVAANVSIVVVAKATRAKAYAEFYRVVTAVRSRCGAKKGETTLPAAEYGVVKNFDYKMFSPRAGLVISVSADEDQPGNKRSGRNYSTKITIAKHYKIFP